MHEHFVIIFHAMSYDLGHFLLYACFTFKSTLLLFTFKYTELFRTVHLKMVKMVNLTLYIFPLHTIFKNVVKEFASS